ncbi:MAG TPA: Gfo/Idh/MocA family oxidoreductase [Spirochaetia bacterium]|nr:Gfo/Idh/MocA family oxidoreductase [Spirochaetia bacterium]
MKIAIVGCGNISARYSEDLKGYPELELVGFYDIDRRRAEDFASKHGGRVFTSLEELLSDRTVELVVNLTIFEAHYSVVKQGLMSGKHVYSEKPLALTYAEAQELVSLAEARLVQVASAPFTFLGEAQQTAMKWVRDGRLGPLRLVYAEVNHGRIESWHPNPEPFYAVGPNLDVGVYPLTLVTALLGPAKRLQAFAATLYPHRVDKGGKEFTVTSPDYYVVNLQFPEGQVMRLTTNFYVSSKTTQGEGIEFHGDMGSLQLDSWAAPDSGLSHAKYGEGYSKIEPVKQGAQAIDWASGLFEFAHSIAQGRRSRVTGKQAAHIVEILEATQSSVKSGAPIELTSTFEVPDAMTWAE